MIVLIRTVNEFQAIIQNVKKIDILMKNKCNDCETEKEKHCVEKKCHDCSGSNEIIINKDIVHHQQIENVSHVKII